MTICTMRENGFSKMFEKRENRHLDGADVCWLREIFFHREEQIDRVLKIHNEYFYQIYIAETKMLQHKKIPKVMCNMLKLFVPVILPSYCSRQGPSL